jgi:hypothetical protein
MKPWIKQAFFAGLLLAVGMASGEGYKNYTAWRAERLKRFYYAKVFVHKLGPGYRITASTDDEDCPPGNDCYWYAGINSQGQFDEAIVYSGGGR